MLLPIYICCYFAMLLPIYICCYFAMLLPHAGVVDNIILGNVTPCSLGLGRGSSLTRDRVDRHTCLRCVERTEPCRHSYSSLAVCLHFF